MLLSQANRHEEAFAANNRALALSPAHPGALHNRAVAEAILQSEAFVRRHGPIPMAPTLHASLDHAVETAMESEVWRKGGLVLEFGVYEGASLTRIAEIACRDPPYVLTVFDCVCVCVCVCVRVCGCKDVLTYAVLALLLLQLG